MKLRFEPSSVKALGRTTDIKTFGCLMILRMSVSHNRYPFGFCVIFLEGNSLHYQALRQRRSRRRPYAIHPCDEAEG